MGGRRRSLLLVSVLFLTGVVSARAQDVTCIFVAPSTPLTAGSRGSVWLSCVNNSSQAVSRTFEPSLRGTFTSGSNTDETVLSLNTSSSGAGAVVAPGGFVKEEYLVDVPPGISGQVSLDVSNYNQVAVLVNRSASGTAAAAQPASTPAATNAAVRSSLVDFLGKHLSTYEPIYFLIGSYPAVEFQLSFKYKLFDFKDGLNPLAHFYFAYTQTSFWDLFARSPSFYDTSYKPSGFLYYTNVVANSVFHLDLQGGVEHESNGRGGAMERSLNTTYLQPTARFDLPAHFQFTLQPRAWCYEYVGGNNPDLDAYRGYADLLSALTWTSPRSYGKNPDCIERVQFATKLRIGDEGSHAGLLFDLRFNLAALPVLRTFNPTFQVQYFSGYGQTLRQYNETSHAFRAGLCLWY